MSSNAARLEALAVRCEAATGPDRALDYDIAHFATGAHFHHHGKAPAYTKLLDAGMTLLPQDVGTQNVGIYVGLKGCTYVTIRGNSYLSDPRAEAATGALALTAACLRARAALTPTPPA